MRKTIRNILVSIVVLTVLFVVAGALYVFVSGRSGSQAPVANAATVVERDPVIKPTKPSIDAAESAAVENITSPIAVGENASLSVKTLATSVCKIQITKGSLVYKDSGLTTKTADSFGTIIWTWTVTKTTPVGKWLIQVDCAYHGRTAMVQNDLIVTK